MNMNKLNKIISEEVDQMIKASEKDYEKIKGKLEQLRKKLWKEPEEKESLADKSVCEKRMQLSLVAEIINIPVNELMLYFLNCVKNKNERSEIEYHLGSVYFYNNE